MPQSLINKKIIISAGASGIGWSTAKICLSRGAIVYICDIDSKSLKKAQKQKIERQRAIAEAEERNKKREAEAKKKREREKVLAEKRKAKELARKEAELKAFEEAERKHREALALMPVQVVNNVSEIAEAARRGPVLMRKRKDEKDLNFKPIPSPIHPIGHKPESSVYTEKSPGHFVLTSDSGY